MARTPQPPRRASTSSRRAAGASGSASSRRSAGADARGRQSQPGFFNYPRAGKGAVARWLPSWRFILGVFLLLLALGGGLFAYAYATTNVPTPADFAQAQTTTVYYADGETAMGSFAEYDRQIVELESLPEHVGAAVVASEDRRFYQNNGVDVRATARALWNNIRGGDTQGGSTLTQQYVENYYMGRTTTLPGKVREAILALKIDASQSKDTILENYLNTIYFGRGTYGIERAAQEYFGKPAAELTLSESALLAGIIPAPSAWDPAVNPEIAERRWTRTLDFMVEEGLISAEERAAQTLPEVLPPSTSDTYVGPSGYILDTVRQELVNQAGMTEEEIDTGGFSIVTTIDKGAQDGAVAAVDALPEDRPENNRVGLVSIDPSSGAVVAMYGGPDFVTQSRNAATQDTAQAGSTFKPFGLVAALEEGKSLWDTYPSYSPMEIEGYDDPVRNYDGRNRGRIDLVTATQWSVNTVYAQLNVEVGPDRAMDVAIRAGLEEDTPGLAPVPSNVLGPASPRVIDMAQAYATFAAQGVRHEPYLVGEVRDQDGNVVYTGRSEGERVFDPDVMSDATYAMTRVIENGTGTAARELGRPAAGKTGTSQAYRSAWFAGYTPQLATAVAMYQVGPDGEEEVLTPFGGVTYMSGSEFPADIWTQTMAAALEGEPVEEFPEPAFIRNRPSPPPAPEPEPTTPEPTEEPTTEEPTEEPTTEEPTEEPEPEPEPTTPEPAEPEPPTEPGPSVPPVPPGEGGDEGDGGRGQVPPPEPGTGTWRNWDWGG